jgi:catalase
MPTGAIHNLELARKILEAFDEQFGLHPGYRPVHAKGVMCVGTFRSPTPIRTPARAA